ncbi:MAG: Rne/Rng family ribonuclease [Pseudomonadota bacterium]
MAKKMLIDATHAEETRVVVVDGNKVEEFDFESENKRQLAGNIYLAKVTRVEPSLQAAFVDYGGNRHGFLAFSEIHPDYYQIPVADREALLAEEAEYARALDEAEEDEKPKRRRRSRSKAKAEDAPKKDDAVATGEISGMDVVELDDAPDVVEVPEAEAEAEVEGNVDTAPEAGVQDDSGTEAVTESAESEEPPADGPEADTADPETADAAPETEEGQETGEDDTAPYVAADDASDRDETIESVADEDVAEEIRAPRRQKPRRYKIQEVIKVRQILLVQVVKEERGNKGAALTTYLSLAGRYCVLMPNTARGGGISRKITNAADRKKLKEIASEIDVPKGAGLIVRTAGAKRTKTEIKRDYEYLQRMWEQIRELTLKSIAPAQIYEEGNLIKRSIRDLYNRDIDEVHVEGDEGYRVAKDFMKMIMPSHAKNVKHYADGLPLFARYQVESYLGAMFNPTVQLKSGGYIVIGVTEALVAIDVNSGRATKEGSIEETALKTNLEAAEEVARQLRLRDLAGLIVIDFIDMEERKNNAAVEKRFKEKLKTDRARIQVGRISGFGLLEMSRQRLRPGMLEATTQPCPHCHGTGLVRSDDSLGLQILRQIEEEGVRGRSKEVLVKAPITIVNFLMNQKREHIAQIEGRYGMSVRIEADPFLISPDFSIEKFKTATRSVVQTAPVVSVDDLSMVDEAEADDEIAEAVETEEESTEEQAPKKRRRRRRRRRGGGGDAQTNGEDGAESNAEDSEPAAEASEGEDASDAVTEDAPEDAEAEVEAKPKRRRSRRRKAEPEAEPAAEAEAAGEAETDASEASSEPANGAPEPGDEAPAKPRRRRRKAAAPAEPVVEDTAAQEPRSETLPDAAETATPEPVAEPSADVASEEAAPSATEPAPEPEPATQPEPEPAVEPEPALAEAEPEKPAKPKRRGWWSLGG